MKGNGIFYNLRLFCSLLKFFMLTISILNEFPDSVVNDEVIIEKNKISIKLCKIGRVNKTASDKYYKSICELVKTGLLELEECSDKNFHKLTYKKGNIQKYFKSIRINRRAKIINKQLRLLLKDINN